MPRTRPQALQLVDTLKATRDNVDISLETDAVAKEQAGNTVAARRLRSLTHTLEKQKDTEICVSCIVKKSDSSEIIGATHIRYRIQNRTINTSTGGTRLQGGLITKFMNDIASVSTGGKLIVNGKLIG